MIIPGVLLFYGTVAEKVCKTIRFYHKMIRIYVLTYFCCVCTGSTRSADEDDQSTIRNIPQLDFQIISTYNLFFIPFLYLEKFDKVVINIEKLTKSFYRII